MDRPAVSIIIPHYLGDLLSHCVESVYSCSRGTSFEVILVSDQPYDDGSVSRVLRKYPTVRVIRTSGAEGFARACNQGMKAAKGEFLLLLNNDVEVSPGWLNPLVQQLRQDPKTGACAPKVRSLRKPENFDYSGAAGGSLDVFGYPFARGRLFGSIEEDVHQYDRLGNDVCWVSGCAMLIRRSALDEVGLLDETFFMQMEEIDLCWRLRLAGYKIKVCTDSVIHHYDGYSLPTGCLKKTYLNYRNNLSLLIKNLEMKNLLWLLPSRIALQWITVLLVILKPSEWRHLAAAILGGISTLWNLPKTLQARRKIQERRRVSDEEIFSLWYRGSIVWKYFIEGKRAAEDLTVSRIRRPQRRLRTRSRRFRDGAIGFPSVALLVTQKQKPSSSTRLSAQHQSSEFQSSHPGQTHRNR